jgi:hypothetical protein
MTESKNKIMSSCCSDENQTQQLMTDPTAHSVENTPPPRVCNWISGSTQTSVGDIPIAKTVLDFKDKLGAWKARWGIGRMQFRVNPGLYAVGRPTENSLVFVSANYKMSFDRLRSNLNGIDGWIMVLDTKGINVWCAAGKGTFGTDEIVRRIKTTKLESIVSHRKLVVPQLGAPGVAAHKVKELSGFRVIYGPVRAEDIPAFLDRGRKTTPPMRLVKFTFGNRLALVPNEIISNFKYLLLAAVCMALLSGFGSGIYSLHRVVTYGMANALILLMTFIVGTTLPQALLPWIPGRAFALKGTWVGLLLAAALWGVSFLFPGTLKNNLTLIAWFIMIPAAVSFIAMNFTGSSTYTSLSGVLKEMRYALPFQIGVAAIGLTLWVIALFI